MSLRYFIVIFCRFPKLSICNHLTQLRIPQNQDVLGTFLGQLLFMLTEIAEFASGTNLQIYNHLIKNILQNCEEIQIFEKNVRRRVVVRMSDRFSIDQNMKFWKAYALYGNP